MPDRYRKGLLGVALEEVERRTGMTFITHDERALGEQAVMDLRATWREMDLLGYSVLDYFSGNPSELRPESRRAMAKKSLMAWMHDPQAYRSTELLIDFSFGRGVPQPRAKSAAVQRVLDDFWNDPDNKILVSSAEGQRRMARDLIIQSNVFPLIFDDGDDGKVKVGLLTHDAVDQAVRDEDNRLRILYYAAREQKMIFNYELDRYERPPGQMQPKVTYYEHWANPQAMRDEGMEFKTPPEDKRGKGKVYHLVENVTSEMAFGVPTMQRSLRWLAAYNDFQAARVDMMKAAAAFIMKRKIKGTPNQLAKLATKAISRESPLSSSVDMAGYPMAGRAAAIINENENVEHESLKIDSGASNAVADADMLHGQIAAGTGLPKHYLGSSDANLATATAMELFVIKRVEAFQEIFESFFRVLFDAAIQRAVDSGLLDRYEEEERAENEPLQQEIQDYTYDQYAAALQQAGFDTSDEEQTKHAIQAFRKLREDYEDQTDDEKAADRDLSYEFSMPSPLRRMMADLIAAITGIAQTFDPNNTNIELSRALLAIALGEALEVDDPGDLVKKVYPPGYVDPMFALAAQQGGGGGEQPGGTAASPNGASANGSGANKQDAGSGSAYGAPMKATPPEKVRGAQEGAITLRGRDGQEVLVVPLDLEETTARTDEIVYTTVRGHATSLDELFDSEVGQVATEELERLALATTTNGKGR